MLLKGLITALVTPFDSKGKLDESGLRQNIQFQIKNKVDGIVLLGTTGETPTLTHQEKERIMQIGFEEIKGKAKLIVGTGSYSTQQTIEDTIIAKNIGADAALVVVPYYNKPTQEGIFKHFQALCEAVALPICVYNVHGRTGLNLKTETLIRISNLPMVIGVKEASGMLDQIDEIIQKFVNKPFSILSGDDALTLPIFALGGHGIISVVSNLIPKALKELVEACQNSDFEKARLIHQKLTPMYKAAFIETNPIPIKTAMQMCGMPSGFCRLPLCDLVPENKEKLQHIIETLPREWLNHG
ncbi:MAG: 4-hydroxy-tetrahydrodipicolinate synthase [Parachlamydiaceae bacterium]|nr:4-hydroxy-tetrahydrodipicolinate synthase [Parachlamydiaceae bacterium]